MDLAQNVFRQHKIKMSDRNRIHKRRAVEKERQGRRWGTYWAREYYKRRLTPHARRIRNKLNYELI